MQNKNSNSIVHKLKKSLATVIVLCLSICHLACAQTKPKQQATQKVLLGVEQTALYFPLLQDKNVAFVGNHTSILEGKHLVDSLLAAQIKLVKVFSPEHGFRGDADAGEKVKDGIDVKTGLPIISLYGKNKKPTASQLEGIDVILFDIQDVGVRFYTYISTLHYVMEAAAESKIKVIVLDRPNPNGHYVDGPILEKANQSFIGMHPVPIVHGMTIGEYARMIQGEKWLKNGVSCDLSVISCLNYTHQMPYEITLSPSPNLPNTTAILLYPSLCLFEGTPISVGRGTDKPFQQFGHPSLREYTHRFTPQPSFGASNPKLNGQTCFGEDLSSQNIDSLRLDTILNLDYLIDVYQAYPNKEKFFTSFFTLLAGTKSLEEAIRNNRTADEIRESWQLGLDEYQKMRKKYLLYP